MKKIVEISNKHYVLLHKLPNYLYTFNDGEFWLAGLQHAQNTFAIVVEQRNTYDILDLYATIEFMGVVLNSLLNKKAEQP